MTPRPLRPPSRLHDDQLLMLPWYPQAWKGSKARAKLPHELRSVYRELLDAAWLEKDGGLPADDPSLAALADLPLKRWLQVKDQVLEFFVLRQKRGCSRIYNRKLSHERKISKAKREIKRSLARHAAKQRWLKEKEACGRNADAMRTVCPPSPSPSPSPGINGNGIPPLPPSAEGGAVENLARGRPAGDRNRRVRDAQAWVLSQVTAMGWRINSRALREIYKRLKGGAAPEDLVADFVEPARAPEIYGRQPKDGFGWKPDIWRDESRVPIGEPVIRNEV